MRPATAPDTDLEDGPTKTPLVTVVIPAYNAARYIAATLNSVLNQTFRDFDVIVVNDGSPDTADLERALEPYIARVRYIKQTNGGPSSARNTDIRQASGKYIAFLDSDDLWRAEHSENLTAALRKDPSLGLTYSNGVRDMVSSAADASLVPYEISQCWNQRFWRSFALDTRHSETCKDGSTLRAGGAAKETTPDTGRRVESV